MSKGIVWGQSTPFTALGGGGLWWYFIWYYHLNYTFSRTINTNMQSIHDILHPWKLDHLVMGPSRIWFEDKQDANFK